MLVAALAHEDGDGGVAAQAQRIGMRAGVLSISNDEVFAAATRQLLAAATGEGDGFWLEVTLAEAAATPRVICETACDLAQLAAHLAHTCDGVRRADYVGIAHLSAAAASAAAVLVRSNLVISDDDWRLMTASSAAAEAARAAIRRRDGRSGRPAPGGARALGLQALEAALELAPQRGCGLDPVGRERLLEVVTSLARYSASCSARATMPSICARAAGSSLAASTQA